MGLFLSSRTKMVERRVTYRRRLSYNTKSNKVRVVRTPGGKLTVQYKKKNGATPRCGDCGGDIHGIAAFRPKKLMAVSKPNKTVTRAYGGSRCANCVRERILRAFLIGEANLVKKFKTQRAEKK